MKRRKRHGHLISNMNVVPYIDVMLVLLIIFMVTAPMFVPAVINLPSVGKAATVAKVPIEISIDLHGNYMIMQKSKTYPVNGLNNLINKTKQFATNDTPVVISADKEVKYNDVIKVVDKLYGAGIKKVALVVKERNG
jgi:biopolymer transport protein TolR